jgi:hypothetical protein
MDEFKVSKPTLIVKGSVKLASHPLRRIGAGVAPKKACRLPDRHYGAAGKAAG